MVNFSKFAAFLKLKTNLLRHQGHNHLSSAHESYQKPSRLPQKIKIIALAVKNKKSRYKHPPCILEKKQNKIFLHTWVKNKTYRTFFSEKREYQPETKFEKFEDTIMWLRLIVNSIVILISSISIREIFWSLGDPTCCLAFTAWRLLPGVCCLAFAAWCLLPGVCCLAFAA